MRRASPQERALEDTLRRLDDAIDEKIESDLLRIEREVDRDIELRIREAEHTG